MASKTYSSLDITWLHDGLKMTGWNELTINSPVEKFKQSSDATGGKIYEKQPGHDQITVDLNIDQTGMANTLLSASFIEEGTYLDVFKDNNGLSVLMMEAKVNKKSRGYGKEKKDKTWQLVGFEMVPEVVAGNSGLPIYFDIKKIDSK